MITGSLKEVARDLQARLVGVDRAFSGVTTDSRVVRSGQLYVALKGDRFDGHEYAGDAVNAGAVGCVVDHECEGGFSQVLVDDTRLALGSLARLWRSRFLIPVIGVTGSNGKTTVKEMIASVLGQTKKVLATRGNLNNDIGLPLTLFNLSADHQVAVVEMGANHPGEIDYLTSIAKPDVAVLTNAGPAHLEGFGSLEGVARAKGEMFTRLSAKGTAIINRDDDFFDLWKDMAAGKNIVTFGLDESADFHARREPSSQMVGEKFTLCTPVGEAPVRLALAGVHNTRNALAAAAACFAVGYELGDIVAGLEQVEPVSGRLQFNRVASGALVCDDTYNANPVSLKAAMETLADMPGTPWLVLGDMGELGPDAERLHRESGALARKLGVQRLFGFGRLCAVAVEAFGEGGQHFTELDSLLKTLLAGIGPEHCVLVKGSRAMRMERVVQALTESADNSLKTGN